MVVVAVLFFACSRPAWGTTNLIVNGNFSGNATPPPPWGILPNEFGVTFDPGVYMSMGNYNGQVQQVYQTITFPSNLIGASLSLYNETTSTDPNQDDYLSIFLTGTNSPFQVLQQIGTTVSSAETTTSWVYGSTNFITYGGSDILSSFAGQTVNLVFFVTTDPTYGAGTSFFISDVSLVAGTTADIPSNDDFANATLIPPAGITNDVNTTYASKEQGEHPIAGNPGGHSIWWTWTAPSIGTVNINTAGSDFVTLLGVYTGSSLTNLTVVTNSSGANLASGLATVKFSVSEGTQYVITMAGYNGQSGSGVFAFKFHEDKTPPTATIKSPVPGAFVTNSTIVVNGSASDNVAVAAVYWQLENADGSNGWQLATGTNKWSATITNLIPGTNKVRVEAFDTSSNVSKIVAHTYTYVFTAPLSLTKNGNGTISGATNAEWLRVGYKYTLTAKAGSGYVFSNWMEGADWVATNGPVLKFIMESNLSLTANFIPNPFIPEAGTYQGLFFNPDDVTQAGSGFFHATVENNGAFTAKFQQGSKSIPIAGQFSLTGDWSTSALKSWGNTAIELQLDLPSGNFISGLLSNSAWTSQLNAGRAVFSKTNPAPEAGKYTLILPVGTNSATMLGGNGFGAVTVVTNGGVTFAGTLGDGTKVTQMTTVTSLGEWPFYVSFESGRGMLLGWLNFTNEPDLDLEGQLYWFKPSQPASATYKAGFTNTIEADGSAYSFAKGEPVLDLTNGYVLLNGGGLTQNISDQFTLEPKNIVVGSNKLHLTFTTATGLFQGTTTNALGKTMAIGGAVFQKQTNGFGLFLNTNQTGSVYLAPP